MPGAFLYYHSLARIAIRFYLLFSYSQWIAVDFVARNETRIETINREINHFHTDANRLLDEHQFDSEMTKRMNINFYQIIARTCRFELSINVWIRRLNAI